MILFLLETLTARHIFFYQIFIGQVDKANHFRG